MLRRRLWTTEFLEPPGEAALASPESISWRIFKNPVALFVGGVAAVILELAEPAVRTGVWEHTDFRRDPMRRLQRTGLAAMVTVYAGRSVAEKMIARVVALHERVQGTTPAGEPYRANDPRLLTWVQATAAFGFIEAYRRYARPLTPAEIDRAYAEGAPAASLYGARDAPRSDAERRALFEAMRPRLEASPIVFEFLEIMRAAPIVPAPLRPLQRLLIRAAVEIVPDRDRERLGLGPAFSLRGWQRGLVRLLGGPADRVVLPGSPAVQSCRRLGLPAGHLYRRRGSR
jgi:uncharacterized protein (DUF2236 family)